MPVKGDRAVTALTVSSGVKRLPTMHKLLLTKTQLTQSDLEYLCGKTVKFVWENSIIYFYFVDQDQDSIQCNEPKYIPEGYREAERFASEHWIGIAYMNEGGDMITWDQMLVQDGEKLTVDIEYDEQIIKEINGKNAVISLYFEGSVVAYCEYGEYAYLMTADNLSIDEVCLMFNDNP